MAARHLGKRRATGQRVLDPVGAVEGEVGGALGREAAAQLLAHLRQLPPRARRHALGARHMPAEGRADRRGHRALVQRKGRVGERADRQISARGLAQLARAAARLARPCLDGGEVGAIAPRLGERLRRLLGRHHGLGEHAPLRPLEACAVRRVGILDVAFGDLDLRDQPLGVERGDRDVTVFRRRKAVCVVFVKARELRFGGPLRLGRVGEGQLDEGDGAPFELKGQQPLRQQARRRGTRAHGARELLAREIGAQQAEEPRLGQPVLPQEVVEHVAREAPVEAAKPLDAEDEVAHRIVRHREVEAVRLHPQHAVGDEGVERLLGHGAAQALVRLDAALERAGDALQLAVRRLLRLGHLDRLAADAGDRGVAEGVADHVLDAPDREGNDEEREEDLREPGAREFPHPGDHGARRIAPHPAVAKPRRDGDSAGP